MNIIKWTDFRTRLLQDLLFLPRMFRGNNDEEEDEVIEEFRDSLEERLGIDLDTICHCMYTIALELENKIYTKGGDNDDNNNKEGGL